ncbi:MAG: signal peptidase I [Oscillospiraceae bacterium]|nr:signal peptidase I [Oscillospiraceae bacterium]
MIDDNIEDKNTKKTKIKKEKSKGREVMEWIVCVLIAVILALLVRYFISTPTVVQQPSMETTLMPNERLLLNKLSITIHSPLKRGDIVTFEAPSVTVVPSYMIDPNNPVAIYNKDINGIFAKFAYYVLETTKTSYIKRVIGLPGDHVQIQNGKVYINGQVLDEPYLQPGVVTAMLNETYFSDVIVPNNCVFLMGDNREYSSDSRSFGCIPIDKIESKVLIRIWPLNKFGKV